MRELFKQRSTNRRKAIRGLRQAWSLRPRAERDEARDQPSSKPRLVLQQVWRDAIEALDDLELPGTWSMRPVGKGRLR